MKFESTLTCLVLTLSLLWAFVQGNPKSNKGGHWGPWGEMSTCSVTCGSGMQTMIREWIFDPDDPAEHESWTGTQVFTCTSKEYPSCPRDGSWTVWSMWSSCSALCGAGHRLRQRACSLVAYGGKDCEGDKVEKKDCSGPPCPALVKNMHLCTPKENFTCASQNMCVGMAQRCDGTVDCHDASDEYECKKVVGSGSVRYVLGGTKATTTVTGALVILSSVISFVVILIFH